MVIKNICCIGAGSVGGPVSSVIALKCPDIKVTLVDTNIEKISQWNSSKLPLYEPQLDNIVSACRGKNLFFSTDTNNSVLEADLIFITVDTPAKLSGKGKGKASDLIHVEDAARLIANIATSDKIVVEKSTVPVRTAESVLNVLNANNKPGISHQILSNPEFLSEGSAISDLLNPDRVLIGGECTPKGLVAADELIKIYEHWIPREKILTTNMWSSELSKLAANAMLAQRISSVNSLSALCESTGADISEVSRAIGFDSRIGSKFLQASVGFSGHYLQKDILNLVYICESLNLHEVANYWQQVLNMNEYQKTRFTSKIIDSLLNTVAGKKLAIFGFAVKNNSKEVKESSAVHVIKVLIDEGALINVYDPAVEEPQIYEELTRSSTYDSSDRIKKFVKVCSSAYSAAESAHAIIVCTEWDEFAKLNYKNIYTKMMKPAYIFDGRNILDHKELLQIGYHVHSIGKKLECSS